MAKSNIVYQYFKKEDKDHTIFIQFDPTRLSGSKLIIESNGEMELEEMEFESDLPRQLNSEGFVVANPLEFHILINGLQ